MNVINALGDKAFYLLNAPFAKVARAVSGNPCKDIQVDSGALGFKIPSFGDMLTFLVKGFFVIAGIAALVMLLWGALAWVVSGGEQEKVEEARNRIVAALIGLFLILVSLSIIWTLEQIVFQRTVCFGLSCPVSIPQLLAPFGGNSGNGSNSNSSHIFAKPTPNPFLSPSSPPTHPITQSPPLTLTIDPQSLTPTHIQQLPGTGL